MSAALRLAAVAAVLLFPGTAGALTLAPGFGAGVILGTDGTAYLAWNGPEVGLQTTLEFCILPKDATACSTRKSIPVPGTAAGPAFVYAYERGLVVGSPRFNNGARGTTIFVSTDGGATFDTGPTVAGIAFENTVAGPGSTVSGTNVNGQFQNAPFGVTTTPTAKLSTDYFGGGAIGLVDAATPLVVFNDNLTGLSRFRRYDGSGDLNDVANWLPAVDIGSGFFPRMAYGPKGLFLINGPQAGQIAVRKFDGTTFGAPAILGDGNTSTTDISQDSDGRLHVVYENGRVLQYRTSDDGVTWTSATLPTDPGRTARYMRVSTSTGHQGIAVWTAGPGGGDPEEIRVDRFGPGAAPPPTPTPDPTPPLTVRRVPRFTGTGSAKRSGNRARVKINARLVLPRRVDAADGCNGGVRITVRRGKRKVGGGVARVGDDCRFTFADTVRVNDARRLRIRLLFKGNAVLTPALQKDSLRIT